MSKGFELREVKIFLTGPPGSGKSTVMTRSVEILRGLGFTVGGIATPEVRLEGRRMGFSVIDLATGAEALMAGVEISSNYRVGKYGVDVGAFESVALPALDYAEGSCDLVAIDEIGRMEFFSRPFRVKTERLISGDKPMIAVLHRSYIETYGGKGTVFNVSYENRDHLPQTVAARLANHLKEREA